LKSGWYIVLLLGVAAGLLFSPGVAFSHKVNLFAYQEDGNIFTESYFGDGTPCRGAAVRASDENGTVVAEGITDEEGNFSFPYGQGGKLRIVLRASMGHGEEITLVTNGKDEVGRALPAGTGAGAVNGSGSSMPVDVPASEKAVERIVESRISPLRDSILELRKKLERPTLEKVVGGLGWIIGIAGAYLWGASRRKDKKC
jgi:nickel transport protein